MLKETNDQNFTKDVLESSEIVIIDFWAEWCGPCKQLLPTLEEVANEINDVDFYKINIDNSPNTPTQYGVRGIPTLMLFKQGKQIATKVGAVTKSALIEWINSNK